ncbi:MAG: hypothetical protein JWO31_3188, partial [Phycisphaerales bacterium]|nr:hypothetical protein [Phycisphaerales bacterium]
TVEQTVTTPGVLVPDFVKPQFLYEWVVLPDYQQKYGLRYEPGTGTADVNFQLKDGWMLTGITSKTDGKTPETVAAVGEAVGTAVAGALGGAPAAAASAASSAAKAAGGANVAAAKPLGVWDRWLKNLAAEPPTPSETLARLYVEALAKSLNMSGKKPLTHGLWVYRLEDNGRLKLVECWSAAEGDPHSPRTPQPPVLDIP